MNQNQLSREWLLSTIKSRGLTVENVNYAVRSTNGQLYVDEYKDQLKNPVDRE